MTLEYLMGYINEWADRKGWNGDSNNPPSTIEQQMMNFHAEVSEAWEEIRKGYGLHDVYFPTVKERSKEDTDFQLAIKGNKPEGFPVEIADLVIRILHTCAFHKIDLSQMIVMKMAYNETREHRHGGKKA